MNKVIVNFTNTQPVLYDDGRLFSCLYAAGYRNKITWEGIEYDLSVYTPYSYYVETENDLKLLEVKLRKLLWVEVPDIVVKLEMELLVPTQEYVNELEESVQLRDCVDCD